MSKTLELCSLFSLSSPELEGEEMEEGGCSGGGRSLDFGLSQVGYSLIALSCSLSLPIEGRLLLLP